MKPLPTYAVNDWQQLLWHRPRDGRRYHAELKQNLFGQWTIVRTWGGAHSRQGQSMETLCQNYDEGLVQLSAVAKRRSQRGYVQG